MEELAEFLKEDLNHLFDEQGIDASKYDEDVKFQDPITSYNGIDGYLFNIQFLRYAFDPTFKVFSIKQTGPYEITTRWTMGMSVGRWFPLQAFWKPEFLFTGTSIMGVNPQTGRFCSHVDTWDSIKDQDYLSAEAVKDLVTQFMQFYRTPELETPEYTVLKRLATFEVREYEPIVVAEAMMNVTPPTTRPEAPSEMPAGAAVSKAAFEDLAGYLLGGKNALAKTMEMTTPVLTTEDETATVMKFVIPPSMSKELSDLPAPSMPTVQLKKEERRQYAVRKFNGISNNVTAKEVADVLRFDIAKEKLTPKTGFTLARYNDPSTPAFFRRNEVLIELDGFQLE